MKKSKNKRTSKDYIEDILSYIGQNPSGVTITDIANGIGTSRVTVGKYIAILLERNEVFTKEIGAYKLYYSIESKLIPRELIYSYFTGLLSGLDEIVDDKTKLKLIGKAIAERTNFPYGSKFPEEVLPKNNGESVIEFLKFFGKMIPFVPFMYRNKIRVETKINKKEKKATYRIGNIRDLSGFMQNHFYIMTSVIEYSIRKKLDIAVKCEVEEMDFENNAVEISLDFI
jgi:predicted transcriptional regulator